MGMYDFDTVHSREGVRSEKWMHAQQDGAPPHVVPMTVADMEFASAPIIVEALKKTAAYGLWGYTCPDEGFQRSVSQWMRRQHGWQPEPQWMVHTFGVVQCIFTAVNACTQPGDGILIQPPVYPPFSKSALQTGRTLIENPLRFENGTYDIDFEDLDAKLPKAKMMVFCNPHNPVGRVWSQDDVEKVATLCKKHNVILFSDEIHCDIIMPSFQHYSAGCMPKDLLENCIIGTAASKTFSLAGLACSTAIIPQESLRQKIQDQLDQEGMFFNNTFGIAATVAAYKGGADWVAEMVEYIHGNYSFFKSYLKENIPEISILPLEGTYLAWVDFRKLGLEGDALQEFLRKEAQVYVNDGRMFGPGGEGFSRFNIACPRSVLAEALARLRQAIRNKK